MPDAPAPYGDIEKLLLDWAEPLWPGIALNNELPYNLTYQTDLLVISRLGGPMGAVPGMDTPMIDVDVFAVGRDRAKALAIEVTTAVRHRLTGVALSDNATRVKAVRSVAGVALRAWDNTDLRRFGATFALTTQTLIHLTQPLT